MGADPGGSDAALVREALDYFWNLHPDEGPRITHARGLLARLAAAAERADEAEKRLTREQRAADVESEELSRQLREARAALLAAQQEREGYRLMVADERRAVKRAEAIVTRLRDVVEAADAACPPMVTDTVDPMWDLRISLDALAQDTETNQ